MLVVRNVIEKVAKDIPSSGSYTLDAKTGGLRKLGTPSSSDYHASDVVMVYEEEKTVRKEVRVNVIDGDPNQDIRPLTDSAHVALIMKDGKIYNNAL